MENSNTSIQASPPKEVHPVKYGAKNYLLRILYAFAGKTYVKQDYWKNWNGGNGYTAVQSYPHLEVINNEMVLVNSVNES